MSFDLIKCNFIIPLNYVINTQFWYFLYHLCLVPSTKKLAVSFGYLLFLFMLFFKKSCCVLIFLSKPNFYLNCILFYAFFYNNI